MDNLERLAQIAASNEQRPEIIHAARAEGKTWEQIAAAAKMSRAGVIKLANTKSRD